MRRFRRFFAVLFIAATLISALHEVIHDHDPTAQTEESCPLYLMSHTPVVLNDPHEVCLPVRLFESYLPPRLARTAAEAVLSQSRSPPLC